MDANKILYCQDVKPHMGGGFSGGFNSRIHGQSYQESCGYPNRDPDRGQGWTYADDMIKDGKLYYQHTFEHLNGNKICKGGSFEYGGFEVCNTCGRKGVNEPWWNVKVMKDGNAWFVGGEGFEDLQASDNYTFGGTKEEALQNYQDKYLASEDKMVDGLEGVVSCDICGDCHDVDSIPLSCETGDGE